MTEEIIIDGVNVAGCDGLNKILLPLKQCNLLQFKTRDGGVAGRWCTDHSNCYYKQLQRLEQENKELKEVKEQLKKWNDENLKRQDDMQLWIDLAEEQRRKYRSALEEIKEVLKFYADTWVDEKIYPNLHYDNTKAKEGLSRINEVLNDN